MERRYPSIMKKAWLLSSIGLSLWMTCLLGLPSLAAPQIKEYNGFFELRTDSLIAFDELLEVKSELYWFGRVKRVNLTEKRKSWSETYQDGSIVKYEVLKLDRPHLLVIRYEGDGFTGVRKLKVTQIAETASRVSIHDRLVIHEPEQALKAEIASDHKTFLNAYGSSFAEHF
ncbi:MAG: hypothetical protein SFT81_00260 [Candidatus Caenarcaniphilales bacterium]|nr:hypothetical protein [Candidatus Caenarcaniphilales bacterium]